MKVRLGVTEDISIHIDVPKRVSANDFLQLAQEVKQLTTGHHILASHDEHQLREAHRQVAEKIEKYHKEFEDTMKDDSLSVEDRLARIEKQTGVVVALLQMLSEHEDA